MVSFFDLLLGGIGVMLLIRATGCLFESLEYFYCSSFLPRETAAGDQSEVWSRFPQIAAMGEGMSRQLQLTQEIARMKKILEAKTKLETIQKQKHRYV